MRFLPPPTLLYTHYATGLEAEKGLVNNVIQHHVSPSTHSRILMMHDDAISIGLAAAWKVWIVWVP